MHVSLCVGLLHRMLIPVSEAYDGDKFFTVKEGVKMATPLLLALAVIEISDVAFAVDSIPAVCLSHISSLFSFPDPGIMAGLQNAESPLPECHESPALVHGPQAHLCAEL